MTRHEYPYRCPVDLWDDLKDIQSLFGTSKNALITEGIIDLVKKKQMELPQLRKARTSIHTGASFR